MKHSSILISVSTFVIALGAPQTETVSGELGYDPLSSYNSKQQLYAAYENLLDFSENNGNFNGMVRNIIEKMQDASKKCVMNYLNVQPADQVLGPSEAIITMKQIFQVTAAIEMCIPDEVKYLKAQLNLVRETVRSIDEQVFNCYNRILHDIDPDSQLVDRTTLLSCPKSKADETMQTLDLEFSMLAKVNSVIVPECPFINKDLLEKDTIKTVLMAFGNLSEEVLRKEMKRTVLEHRSHFKQFLQCSLE
jgi:hypothetical protein